MFYSKTFGALVVGLYLGMKFNMDLVNANMNLFPPPEGFDWTDAVATEAYLSSLPASAFVLVILAHLGQAFFGGWLAARLAPGYPMRMAMTIGILSMVGGIMNQMMIPLPAWTWTEIPFYLIVAYGAGMLEVNRRSGKSTAKGTSP